MKITLLTLLLAFSFLQNNAQCTENASDFGNNSATQSYNINGDVSITLNTNNTVTLNLGSNFSTAAGPDVRAYLINSEGKPTSELKLISKNNTNALIYDQNNLVDNLQFGLIKPTGIQDFTIQIPSGKDIKNYDKIFFFCLDFGIFWDLGTFTNFSSTNCSVLDVNNFNINQINIYPNPAKNEIHISNIDAVSTEIRIFNVLGKQVFYQPKITEKTIDISSFNKGIYIVKLDVDGKTKTQKLVIN
jgi:hypothetical protein